MENKRLYRRSHGGIVMNYSVVVAGNYRIIAYQKIGFFKLPRQRFSSLVGNHLNTVNYKFVPGPLISLRNIVSLSLYIGVL